MLYRHLLHFVNILYGSRNPSVTKNVLTFKSLARVVFKMENAVGRKSSVSLRIVIRFMWSAAVLFLPSAAWRERCTWKPGLAGSGAGSSSFMAAVINACWLVPRVRPSGLEIRRREVTRGLKPNEHCSQESGFPRVSGGL